MDKENYKGQQECGSVLVKPRVLTEWRLGLAPNTRFLLLLFGIKEAIANKSSKKK